MGLLAKLVILAGLFIGTIAVVVVTANQIPGVDLSVLDTLKTILGAV